MGSCEVDVIRCWLVVCFFWDERKVFGVRLRVDMVVWVWALSRWFRKVVE